jgi:hypothetical protein
MKTLLCLLAAAALLTGCNQKPDSRVAKYEQRITALESNATELFRQADNRWKDVTNLTAMQKSISVVMDDMAGTNGMLTRLMDNTAYNETRFSLLEAQVTNLWYAQAIQDKLKSAVQRQNYAAPAARGQMPAEVAAKIRAHAAEEFPKDYSMQVFMIGQETEAWRKLNP